MSPRSALLLLLVACPGVAAAQDSPDEQARRLLDEGKSYWAQGKFKQAVDNYNTIVTGFASTSSVDDALLEIGRYYMDVENDAEKAREAFDQVAKRYPQSDGAPGAYIYLGRLALERASSPAELEDALAQFRRVQTLYPRSDWVPSALYAAGRVHRKAGRLAESVESSRRVSLEYPSSNAAPAAQFEIGQSLALLGEPRQAMEEFQQVRNRHPGTEWAARALERVTALYRLHGGAKPSFTLDPSYALVGGDVLKGVRALLMNPAGTLWVASDKAKSVVPFDAQGKMGPSLATVEPRSLSLSPRRDKLLAVAKLAVRIGPKDIKTFAVPGDKPGIPETLEHVAAAVVTPGGSTLVADEKKKRVYRYDAKFEFAGTFPDAKEREVTRMAVDDEGGIVLLDRGERTVRVYDEAGTLLRTVALRGGGFELRRPADFAVDPFRNTYVADEEAGVLVFSPKGEVLATIAGEELQRPRALTLDPSGALLVYDERSQRVLRYK